MTENEYKQIVERKQIEQSPFENDEKIIFCLQEISVALFAINMSLEELGRNVYLVAEQVANK